MDNKLYRRDIDGLRAMAVLSVILYHLGLTSFKGGFVGVDVFFVISGFLITRIVCNQINDGTFSFREFYMRRVRRIMPALIFTMALTLAVAAILFSPYALHTTAQGAVSSLLSVSNFLFWQDNDYFNLKTQMQPLLHTWSLSIEEQFYLIWPAFLVLVLTRYTNRVTYVITALVVIISLALAQWLLKIDASAVFYLMPFRIAEFGIGAVGVWLGRYHVRPLILEIICLAGLIMIACAVLFYQSNMPFPGLTALLPCVGAACILYGGTARYSGWVLRNNLMRGIGLISYSLYLAHWPIIVFTRYQTIATLMPSQMRWIFAATFCLAIFMYRFIEQPFRRKTVKGLSLPYPRIAITATALTLLVAISMWSGWYWRLGDKAEYLSGFGSTDDYQLRANGGAGCDMPSCAANVSVRQKPLIYIVGDSHALMYYAGFKKVFSDYEVRFLTSSGCQLFSWEFDSQKTPDYRLGCDKARAEAFTAMAKNNSVFFIAQMWGIGQLGLVSQHTGDKVSFATNDQYGAFVARQVSQLKQQTGNNKIVLLGDTPGFGQYSSPLDCVSRPYFKPHQCLVNKVVTGDQDLNEAIGKHLLDTIFIKPSDVLCTAGTCRNFIDEKPAYSDDNHLSIDGSIFVVKALEPRLRDIIRQFNN